MRKTKIRLIIFISSLLVISAGSALASLGFFSTDSLNKGLVGYWPLDGEHYNSVTYRVDDLSGYGNHGTNSGATLTNGVKGESNGAMSFNGSSNYVNLGTSGVFNITTALSASIWARYGGPTSQHQFYLCRGYDYTNKKGWNLYISSSGTAELRIGNGSVISYQSFGAAQQDIWVNYAFTYDGSTILTYKNGIYLNSYSLSSPLQYYDQGFHIGNYSSNYNFKGSLADARVYNRVLSPAEITRLYESYKPKLSTGTLNQKLVLDMPLRPGSERLGSEKVNNGSFDSNTTGWSAGSSTLLSVSGGEVGNALQITNTTTSGGTASSTSSATRTASLRR